MNFLKNALNAASRFMNDAALSGQKSDVILTGNGERILFPVPLTNFMMDEKNNNTVINVNNRGDLNMIGKEALNEISVESFFPAQNYTFCSTRPEKPYGYVDKIKALKSSGKPLRILMTNTNVNMPVLIESFSYGEKDGTCDVYFTIVFKEYRFLAGQIDDTQVNGLTDLKDRPRSALDRIREVQVYPGDNVMDVVARGVGQNVNWGESADHLNEYRKLAKGNLSAGMVLTVVGNRFEV